MQVKVSLARYLKLLLKGFALIICIALWWLSKPLNVFIYYSALCMNALVNFVLHNLVVMSILLTVVLIKSARGDFCCYQLKAAEAEGQLDGPS